MATESSSAPREYLPVRVSLISPGAIIGSSAGLVLRYAHDDDADAIIALVSSVWSEYPGKTLVAATDMPELLKPASAYGRAGGRFWVVEANGQIIGTIALMPSVEDGVVELQKLYVARNMRRERARLVSLLPGRARGARARRACDRIVVGRQAVGCASALRAARLPARQGAQDLQRHLVDGARLLPQGARRRSARPRSARERRWTRPNAGKFCFTSLPKAAPSKGSQRHESIVHRAPRLGRGELFRAFAPRIRLRHQHDRAAVLPALCTPSCRFCSPTPARGSSRRSTRRMVTNRRRHSVPHRSRQGSRRMTRVTSSPRLVALMCVAEILCMAGFATYPALLPVLRSGWGLSNAAAGLVGGILFFGYVGSVPVLTSLTDRIDARRIYLGSCLLAAGGSAAFALFADGFVGAMIAQALFGIGFAGIYMPGLKAMSDRIDEGLQSRATALYTSLSGFGLSGSYFLAGVVSTHASWRLAFAFATLGPLLAALAVFLLMAPKAPAPAANRPGIIESYRLVFRNKPALGYISGYVAHCWELYGSRAWMVAFLTFAAGTATGTAGRLDAPTLASIISLGGMRRASAATNSPSGSAAPTWSPRSWRPALSSGSRPVSHGRCRSRSRWDSSPVITRR